MKGWTQTIRPFLGILCPLHLLVARMYETMFGSNHPRPLKAWTKLSPLKTRSLCFKQITDSSPKALTNDFCQRPRESDGDTNPPSPPAPLEIACRCCFKTATLYMSGGEMWSAVFQKAVVSNPSPNCFILQACLPLCESISMHKS